MNYKKLFLIIAVIISPALFPALVQPRQVKCDRLGGNCIDGGEELIMKMRSGLDVRRMILLELASSRHISYDALKKDVPDKRRRAKPDNPHRRRCDVHSNCYRFTN
ncbi:hypothetical protein EUTSA_v10002317mg [Eutrema salsugineum]|uniref:Uncharacterized protein n=1 Tax=Eutrema salsugineum TaxID=72664 RepID=V4MD78_EUTSA|nr:protein RALF-like 14 [Eutrema salsugineum]ESQ50453.1 hypothetical protein EUTSA_v10002317mg [Eutrema salsugineum]